MMALTHIISVIAVICRRSSCTSSMKDAIASPIERISPTSLIASTITNRPAKNMSVGISTLSSGWCTSEGDAITRSKIAPRIAIHAGFTS
jgi:hypothetical protein